MTEQEQRELARRVAEVSSVFDYDNALRLVRWKPEEAEKILRMRKESERRQEELDRAYERLHRAALEFR